MLKFDLHTHTNASDGELTPTELVALAAAEGVGLLSITDHDTVDGVAKGAQKAAELGIKFVNGVEINADFETEMHILLYGFDLDNPVLTGTMQKVADFRIFRNKAMVKMLQDLGLDISYNEVEEASGEGCIGRIHMAEVLLNKGYIGSVKEGFKKYLGVGRPAYYEKQLLSPKEVISFAQSIGAVTSLAHPKFLNLDDNRLEHLLKELKDCGLWGVECYYSEHTPEETKKYLSCCKKYNLKVTAGSDFHGKNKPHIRLGAFDPETCTEVDQNYFLTFIQSRL